MSGFAQGGMWIVAFVLLGDDQLWSWFVGALLMSATAFWMGWTVRAEMARERGERPGLPPRPSCRRSV
jgi:hypothetical protein